MPRHAAHPAFAALAAAALLLALPAIAAPRPSPAIAAALADAKRPDADRARDADRHAAELLAFAGVRPGQKIADMVPGGGYFTRLFSSVVGPTGLVIAYVPAEMARPGAVETLTAALAAEGRKNVQVVSDPLATPATAEATGVFDLVWTAQNYHDLHNIAGADVPAFDKLIHRLLKPGGVYIVVDHAAPAGSGLAATGTTHRIDPAVVRREVEAAGFRYAGMTAVLANPADPRTAKVFDPAIRGHTDQFAFKFVKPAVRR